jgi:hypothetical protein
MVKNLLFAITAICVIACSTSKTSSKTKLYKRNPEADLVKDSLDLEISKVNIDSIRYHKDSCATLVLRNGASVNIKNHLLFEDTIKFKSCDTAFNFPQVVAKKEVSILIQNQDTLFENDNTIPIIESYDDYQEEEIIQSEEELKANKHAKAFAIVLFANLIGFIINPGLGVLIALGGLVYLIYLLASKKHLRMSRKWKPLLWTGFWIYMAGIAFLGLMILIFALLW